MHHAHSRGGGGRYEIISLHPSPCWCKPRPEQNSQARAVDARFPSLPSLPFPSAYPERVGKMEMELGKELGGIEDTRWRNIMQACWYLALNSDLTFHFLSSQFSSWWGWNCMHAVALRFLWIPKPNRTGQGITSLKDSRMHCIWIPVTVGSGAHALRWARQGISAYLEDLDLIEAELGFLPISCFLFPVSPLLV